jgi:hypothetical protein
MSQARTTQILKDNGYTLVNTAPAGDTNLPIETWLNGVDANVCDISFGDGKLVYAGRHWEPRVKDERSVVEAIVNAVQTVTESQRHNDCEVFSYINTSPAGVYKAIDIICNGHKIELLVTDVNELHISEIEESIGSFLKKKP